MARKSRKETVVLPAPEIDTSCRAGVYVRLSVEDKHTHTASIETQQLIIARYLELVCNKLLPSGQETLSALTEPEQTAARFLFCALIGYLKEEAPKDEQSFPMVMEMLNYAEGAKEDGDKDVIDILMEETAARTHLREEYFSDYRRYQLMQVDKTRVLLACRVIINDLLGKLYRYDYNVGYDCLLDDGNSVSRKLKKSNEEMEVEEDAIGDR